MIKPIKSQKSIVKPLLFNDEWQTIKLQFSMDRIFCRSSLLGNVSRLIPFRVQGKWEQGWVQSSRRP